MAQKKSPHMRPGHVVGVRLREGDLATLDWLTEQLGMSKADVFKRALAAYAAQVKLMNKL